MISNSDRMVLRDFATRYMALCESERNRKLIEDWRRLNNMQPCRPMLVANMNLLGDEIGPQLPECRVTDERLRNVELLRNPGHEAGYSRAVR